MEAAQNLKDLGYAFNSDGHLRKLKSDGQVGEEPFQFNICDQHEECQQHYEELGNIITKYIYYLLEFEMLLSRLPVPSDSDCGTFIFVSKNYTKKNVLMILIHGSGVVRAGQWARSLIINESLEKGTQIPYIQRALTKDYGVMILNTNDNQDPSGKKILHSGNPEEHAQYVWNKYVTKAKAVSIVIVAHSYGGIVTLNLANKIKNDFKERVKAIVFTDSVHRYSPMKMPTFVKQISRNWVSSSEPLDTPIKSDDCINVSAGHPKHEMSSYSCIDSAFKFIEEKVVTK